MRKREPRPGCELQDGLEIGRDPREMTPQELKACGIKKLTKTTAIRAKCLDCVCGQRKEVRLCVAVDCPLWPFRMGMDPWRKASDAVREVRRAAALRMHANKSCKPNTEQAMEEIPEGSGKPRAQSDR